MCNYRQTQRLHSRAHERFDWNLKLTIIDIDAYRTRCWRDKRAL